MSRRQKTGQAPACPEYSFFKIPSRSGLAIFGIILYGVQAFGWWLSDMAGGFFLMGIVAAIVCRLPLGESTRAFVKGMKDMVVAALAVGFARGVTVVLNEGQILDTLIHSAATVLGTVSQYVAVVGMFGAVISIIRGR